MNDYNFKSGARLTNGCKVVATIRGRKASLRMSGPANIFEGDIRVYVHQLNGRGKGSNDAMGLGSASSGNYNSPNRLKIFNILREDLSRNLYDDIWRRHDYQSRESTQISNETVRDLVTIDVWTDEKEGKEITFWISVSRPTFKLSLKTCNDILNRENKTLAAEVRSLKSKIKYLDEKIDSIGVPKHLNKQTREALLKALKFEHVTSYDVEFFASYLLKKNGKQVELPSRMQNALERNVPNKGNPPIVGREVYSGRQGLGYRQVPPPKQLSLEAVSFVPQAVKKDQERQQAALDLRKGKSGDFWLVKKEYHSGRVTYEPFDQKDIDNYCWRNKLTLKHLKGQRIIITTEEMKRKVKGKN